jgi:hypothetical protein
MLGRVPEGSTPRSVKDGTLPSDAKSSPGALPDRELIASILKH